MFILLLPLVPSIDPLTYNYIKCHCSQNEICYFSFVFPKSFVFVKTKSLQIFLFINLLNHAKKQFWSYIYNSTRILWINLQGKRFYPTSGHDCQNKALIREQIIEIWVLLYSEKKGKCFSTYFHWSISHTLSKTCFKST